MQFRETLLLVQCQAFVWCGYRWALVDRCAERTDDGSDDVADVASDMQTVEFDDVAGDEGVVGVVDQMGGVRVEILQRILARTCSDISREIAPS